MAYCNVYLAFLYLSICVFLFGIKFYFVPISMKYTGLMQLEQGKLTQYLNESLLQIDKVRSANIESSVFRLWLKQLTTVKVYAESAAKIDLSVSLVESIIPVALLLSFYAVAYHLTPSFDSGFLLQFMICSAQFVGAFDRLSLDIFKVVHMLPNLKRVKPLILQSGEVYDVNKINQHCHGEVKFANVSLCVRDAGALILDNISFEIPAGKFVAFVGHSGAGKSSLLRLLLGFESPSSGVISMDNVNIQNLNLRDIRKQCGVVLQTTHILPGTIFSNISANRAMTHEEAWRLAGLVGLNDDIHRMPMKMHTYISDNSGESISGGQRQKLMLARALAANPKILLLDEATSALDNQSQALILRNLESMSMTRIVVAHRYSTIMNADRIYVLDKGRIVAYGTYVELVRQGLLK